MSQNIEKSMKIERELWLVAIGAALASPEFRDDLLDRIPRGHTGSEGDTPDVIEALRDKDGKQVWRAVKSIGIDRGSEETVCDALAGKLEAITRARRIMHQFSRGMLAFQEMEHDAVIDSAKEVTTILQELDL